MELSPSQAYESSYHLLNLPTEIRFKIYGNLIPSQLERFLDLYLRPLKNNPCFSISINKQLACLFLVCKQFNVELSQIYPCDSLTLRLRPTLSWCQLPGPDPLILVGREPLQDYFNEIIGRLISSEEDAQLYLDLFRNNKERTSVSETHASRARFPEPADVYDYPHPQFGLVLTALSAFSPISTMFQRVHKLEITDDLLGRRYPYLLDSWIYRVFPNLRCLNILRQHEITKYESSVTWNSIDPDFWKFDPQNNDGYGWEDQAKSLAERGIHTLWSGHCQYSLRCYDPQWRDDDNEEEPFFMSHGVSFSYSLDCQKREVTGLELDQHQPQECMCKFEDRLNTDLRIALVKEGLKVQECLIDQLILDLLKRLNSLIPADTEDAGWDRCISTPVMDAYGLADYESVFSVDD